MSHDLEGGFSSKTDFSLPGLPFIGVFLIPTVLLKAHVPHRSAPSWPLFS